MRHWLLALVVLVGCSSEKEPDPTQQTLTEQVSPATVVVENAVRMQVPADQEAGQLSAPTDALRDALPRCGDSLPIAGSASVGAMRVGMTVAELRTLCQGMRFGWDWGDEGIPEPAVQVNLGGALVEAILSDSSGSGMIVGLETEDSLVRTSSGLRVGSTLADLRQAHGAVTLADAECALYASAPALRGIVFRVDAMTDDCVAVVQAVERPAEFPGASRLLVLYVNGR